MQYLSLLFLIFSFNAFSVNQQVYENFCHNNDCLTYGWDTFEQGGSFKMNTFCVGNNCRNNGWQSIGNDNSSFTIKCKKNACFVNGWIAINITNQGRYLKDDISCIKNNCLKYGWNVIGQTPAHYGSSVCTLNDCSRFGRRSVWRGKVSESICHGQSCYTNGWSLIVDNLH